jgi:hypothetical protein
MTVSFMFGKEAACDIRPTCDACKREVDRVRGSMWHGDSCICTECFCQWYDPDNDSFDPCDQTSLGNYIRSKHGLPPLP